jgi:hypothetical protein
VPASYAGAAMAETGKALQKTSLYLQRFQERLTAAKQANEFADAKLTMREQMADLMADLETHPDYEQIPSIFEDKSQKILQNILKSTQDTEVQAHLKRAWANLYPTQKLQVKRFSRQKMILGMAGDLENQFSRSIEMAAKARTPEDAAGIKADFVSSLRMMGQLGVINPKQAQVMEEKFDDAVSKEKINQLILANPQAALQALQTEDFSGIDANEKLSLIGRATANLHRQQEQNVLGVEKELDEGTLTVEKVRLLRDAQAISPARASYYERLLEAKDANQADTQDDMFAINLDHEILQMDNGDKEKFKQLQDILLNKETLIKYSTRKDLLRRLYRKMERAEVPIETRERRQLQQYEELFKSAYGPHLWAKFYQQYYYVERPKHIDKSGNLKWSHEEMLETMQNIAEPHIETLAKANPLLKPQIKPKIPENIEQEKYWIDNRIFRDETWR